MTGVSTLARPQQPAGSGDTSPGARRPAALVAYPGWRATRDDLLLLAGAGRARIALIGGRGSGKSWMLDEVARVLGRTGQKVGRAPGEGGDCLLIDDADQLDEAQLRAAGEAPGCLILAGAPAAAQRLRPYVTMLVTLAPLDAAEVTSFVQARLASLGRSPELFRGDAVAALAAESGGNPRRLQALLTSALFLASTDSAPQVEPGYIERAADLEDGLAGRERPVRRAAAAAVPELRKAAPAGATRWSPRQRTVQAAPRPTGVRWGAAGAACAAVGLGLMLWVALPRPVRVEAGPARSALPVPVVPAPAPVAVVQPAPLPLPPPPVLARPASAARVVHRQIAAGARPVRGEGMEPVATPPPVEAIPMQTVVVTYPRTSPAAQAQAGALAQGLRDQGMEVELRPMERALSGPMIRYFYAQDRGSAEQVGQRLGPRFAAIRLVASSARDLRRPGMVEVAVP